MLDHWTASLAPSPTSAFFTTSAKEGFVGMDMSRAQTSRQRLSFAWPMDCSTLNSTSRYRLSLAMTVARCVPSSGRAVRMSYASGCDDHLA
eukprot:scaffold1019_cov255-Pinguiococcus_pyrenoidosus.AAC.12